MNPLMPRFGNPLCGRGTAWYTHSTILRMIAGLSRLSAFRYGLLAILAQSSTMARDRLRPELSVVSPETAHFA